ncbi:MAG TPA: hypothetical protein VIV60_16585, partial [Polyangiaceae bacterium]
MAPASEAEAIDGLPTADGKCLAMIELEQAALFAASAPSVDECALSAITSEDLAPHRGLRALSCPPNAKRWNRVLSLTRRVFLTRRVPLTRRSG